MSAEQQHQHQYCNMTCQNCVPKSSNSIPWNMSKQVLSLNNRGCMMIAMGNYSKAKHLFEFALTKHREMVSSSNSNVASRSNEERYHAELATRTSYININSDNDVAMVDVSDDPDGNNFDGYYDYQDCYETSESSFEDDNDDHDCDNDDADDDDDDGFAHPPMRTSIRRMSSCSGLQIIPYSGQEANRPAEKWMHHQIYTLPIVMNETEWENAPSCDRSFVLIFNSAISHHLIGMQLLLQHQQLQTAVADSDISSSFATELLGHKRHLEVARNLYRLAMEAYKCVVSFESERISFGVDRLCFPALFNNLSHVCKTLDGQSSHDAYQYDCFLLKAVYWIIHHQKVVSRNNSNRIISSSSSSNSIQAAASNQIPVPTNRVNAFTSNGADSTVNDCYGDDIAEVLDAFLENVFYLVGSPRSIAPAAAA